MRNMARIVSSDVKHLFANVMSIIIAIGLAVIPSIFAWYNIIACWQVFDNTGNLKVAVANSDEGYQSDLFPLKVNVGEQVIASLRANDDIDWVITDEADAIDGARSGAYYAAVVIPASFSKDMLTFYSQDIEHAQVIYYTNEKKSAIAPKITDRGADTVSYQINKVFAETLSEVSLALASSLSSYAEDADVSGTIASLSSHIRSAGSQMEDMADVVDLYASLTSSADELLASSASLVDAVRADAASLHDSAEQSAGAVVSAAATLGSSAQALSEALGASVEGFAAVNENLDALFDATSQTAADSAAAMRSQAAALTSTAERYRAIASQLAGLKASLPSEHHALIDGAIAMMGEAANQADAMAASLERAASKLEVGNADISAEREAVKAQSAQAQANAAALKAEFDETIKPDLEKLADEASAFVGLVNEGVGELDAAGASLSSTARSVSSSLDEASREIAAAADKLREAAATMTSLADSLDAALASGDVEALKAVLGNDIAGFSKALSAPVGMERIAVYPTENFGSSMTPLYTALAIFIGSLLILVVFKPSVSPRTAELLENPKPRELFLGHFGVMALMSLAQTTVMGLGNLLFLQVQAEHPALFMVCMWTAGLVFTFVIYALVASFANLGKALAVILLIVQVTGCGGSYPLQILPDFVERVSPYLPATHVVNALRAAMMGVYGNDFWLEIGTLLLFLIPAALLGLVLRKPLERFMNWYVEQVESSKVIG